MLLPIAAVHKYFSDVLHSKDIGFHHRVFFVNFNAGNDILSLYVSNFSSGIPFKCLHSIVAYHACVVSSYSSFQVPSSPGQTHASSQLTAPILSRMNSMSLTRSSSSIQSFSASISRTSLSVTTSAPLLSTLSSSFRQTVSPTQGRTSSFSSISFAHISGGSRAANTDAMTTVYNSSSTIKAVSGTSTISATAIASSTTPTTQGATAASQAGVLLLSEPTTLVSGSSDETQYILTLPFNVTLYTETSFNVSVTTNGVSWSAIHLTVRLLILLQLLAITSDMFTSNGYLDTPQPLYTYSLAPGTAAPWWQYMRSDGQSQRGIYYQIDNSNHLSLEYNLLDSSGRPTHFIVTYATQSPGNINFYYLTAGDGGAESTIGVQGQDEDGGRQSSSHDLLPDFGSL